MTDNGSGKKTRMTLDLHPYQLEGLRNIARAHGLTIGRGPMAKEGSIQKMLEALVEADEGGVDSRPGLEVVDTQVWEEAITTEWDPDIEVGPSYEEDGDGDQLAHDLVQARLNDDMDQAQELLLTWWSDMDPVTD